jgi:hypothetical protein
MMEILLVGKMTMRIPLTGATGFLWRYLAERFAGAGHALRCWYRSGGGKEVQASDVARQSFSCLRRESRQGTRSFPQLGDMTLIQQWAKHTYNIDIPNSVSCPNRDMTAQLNPEFAYRLDAVMAIYQGFGGIDLGILPREGGLGTVEMQQNLYKKGRRIKDSDRADGSARDGTMEEDWEERTDCAIRRHRAAKLLTTRELCTPTAIRRIRPAHTWTGSAITWR